MNRRHFIKTLAMAGGALALKSTGAFNYFSKIKQKKYPGQIKGASFSRGHRLLKEIPSQPATTRTTDVVIVGSGIAGLSAAWRFKKMGFNRYEMLELENQPGGNAQSGKNSISAYPWGAHYVPIPGPEAGYVRELFEDLNIITGYDQNKQPIYNDYYLCADPEERLLMHGHWQESLIPQMGATPHEMEQYNRFFLMMDDFKKAKGKNGKRAFVIPISESSQDESFLKLDTLSMAQWLTQNQFDSPLLHWYVNYCCRDDYGTTMDKVSAWAGIHYFAARNGEAANSESEANLTWPEGNGFLVHQLLNYTQAPLTTNALVIRVENHPSGITEVDYIGPDNRLHRIHAKAVIMAIPRFVTRHIIPSLKEASYSHQLHYSPWLVANITLKSRPGGLGAPLSWDNVSYHGTSLGYINATHQSLSGHPGKTVITYYQPLDDDSPEITRKKALEYSFDDWCQKIVLELKTMHPDLEDKIENIDVWLWGHGMIQPAVGFMWHQERKKMEKPIGNIFFAHSDMSGISVFEEAQYWGVKAADDILKILT